MQELQHASHLSDDRSRSRCCNQNERHPQPLHIKKQDELQFQPFPMKLDNKYLARMSGTCHWYSDQYDGSW